MRRFLIGLVVLLVCVAPGAQAMDMMRATDAIFEETQARMKSRAADDMRFVAEGNWMSAILRFDESDNTEWRGIVYSADTDEIVAWDELFTDGDAAAARIEEIAEATMNDDAYAEHKQMSSVPRSEFALEAGQLFIFYPPDQFSHFSGRAGGLAFYAYELRGLIAEGVPLLEGDVAQAAAAKDEVLSAGALPGMLAEWTLGRPMQEAAEKLGLVDVPDYKDNYAVWSFEAPEMRGIALLTAKENDRTATAVIQGIHAERIDFSGLQTGIATPEACISALGEPDARGMTQSQNEAYALTPAGEQLDWQGEHGTLRLTFVDGLLHSVTLLEAGL